jgi:hypothetical protein
MTLSPADSSARKSGGPHRKPRADLYTVLLALALIAILLAILCLYFENKMYNWDYKGGPTVSVRGIGRQPSEEPSRFSPSANGTVPSRSAHVTFRPLALAFPSRPFAPWLSTDAPPTLPLFPLRPGG